jgi:pyruvate,water dikinase
MTLIVDLEAAGALGEDAVGGKATALAALREAGHPVPETLVLTTEAYETFVHRSSLRAVLHQELGRKSFADMRWEEIWDAALRIRNRFLRAPIPDPVVAAVEENLRGGLAGRPLAVRSSAPGEDSEAASFAGLHDSIVGVRGTSETLDAIRRVWASLWTDRALLYRRELGIDIDRSAMAVVVQELVEGTVSGIAFGVHPQDSELAVVEAVYGLNQGLVDGSLEPDRWTLDRTAGRIIEHTPPALRRRMVARGGGTEIEDLPADLAARPPLDEGDLGRVWSALRATERVFGAPQDVEWTMAERGLVLLQSRNVTTAPDADDDKRSWYLSLTRSLENLRGLRRRVEMELLPAMDRDADELAPVDLPGLAPPDLAAEIERRRALHDRWVDTYWQEFIPFAHGIRLFGQLYNDVVHPSDPHEFMNLLAGTPMLSVRRNRALTALADMVRSRSRLRSALESGVEPDAEFAQALEQFQREFGGAVYADRQCFTDRRRLVRLLLAMADAPQLAEAAPRPDVDRLRSDFFAAVPDERRQLAEEILELGRASYRLRDDDNLHLARIESLVLEAVDEGRRRLDTPDGSQDSNIDAEDVVRGLRHPNLVVEPRPLAAAIPVEPGFRALPRQLVGQPAGPGVATGSARLVDTVDDLAEFSSGEVLVCDAVDPNMTFVVPLARAIVERRGGMLIHGAIIAREYGLPCVTGVPNVTTEIGTGERLTVDGYLGIVTVHRD